MKTIVSLTWMCVLVLNCGCACMSEKNQALAFEQRVKLERTDEYVRLLSLAYRNHAGNWPTSLGALDSFDRTNHDNIMAEIMNIHEDSTFTTNADGCLVIEKKTADGGRAKMYIWP